MMLPAADSHFFTVRHFQGSRLDEVAFQA